MSGSEGHSIGGLSVENYKSFYERASIAIGQVTVLSGANSSGKSSIMEPLLLLKQTLDAATDPGPLELDGPNVSFTSFMGQMVSRGGSDVIHIGVSSTSGFSVNVEYMKPRGRPVRIRKQTVVDGDNVVVLTEQMSHTRLSQALPEQVQMIAKTAPRTIGKLRFKVKRNRCFLDAALEGTRFSLPLYPFGGFDGSPLLEEIRGLLHVPASRYNLDRLRFASGEITSFAGEFDDYTASILYYWQTSRSPKLQGVIEDLRLLGVARRLSVKAKSDVELALSIAVTDDSKPTTDIEDVGFGVSQILPVIVALQAAADGRIVYVEEPESHLHPRAQHALALVIAKAAKRGARIILETHSPLLILGLQEAVATDQIESSQTQLHWFSLDSQGHSHIRSGHITPEGALEDWPADFSDASMEAQRRYLRAFTEKSLKQQRQSDSSEH